MDEYGIELTPEEEEAQRVQQFGVFAHSKISVDEVTKTITATLDDALPGKNEIIVKCDTALAGYMIFEEVTNMLNVQVDKLRAKK